MTSSGTSYPMACSSLRKNGHVIINDRPCKIVDLVTRGGKVYITGIDIFTGNKYEDIPRSPKETVYTPNVTRKQYKLKGIEDGSLVLVDQEGILKNNVKLPEGVLGEQIKKSQDIDLLITVAEALGEEQAVYFREFSFAEREVWAV